MTWTLTAPAGKTVKFLQLDFAVYTDYDVTVASKAICKDYVRLNTNEVDPTAVDDLQNFVYSPAVDAYVFELSNNMGDAALAAAALTVANPPGVYPAVYPSDVVADFAHFYDVGVAQATYDTAYAAALVTHSNDVTLALADATVVAAQTALDALVPPSSAPANTWSMCGAPKFPNFHLEFNSKSNEMTIKFHSETGTNVDKGFRFMVTDNDDKNTITKSVTMN